MKNKILPVFTGALIGSILSASSVSVRAYEDTPNGWYQQGQDDLQDMLRTIPSLRKAKNIILFVGDGMGISTVTAARIYAGQLNGSNGEENLLEFEKMPYLGLAKTYNTNSQVPDSAGTMTAMMTGVKTKIGFIGVNQNAERGDCSSMFGNELTSFLEQAEQVGMSTGVVSTARLTHATPAAAYAHSPERGWEVDSKMPEEALAGGCTDIASQLIDFPYGDGIEVALGGGRRNFIPNTMDDPEDAGKTGEREDGRDLTAEWADRKNSAYVWNEADLDNVNTYTTDHLLGLFERSHMEYEADRLNDTGGEPSLAKMTGKAIDILKKNRKGFFLTVEAGRVDHAHHGGNAQRALRDAIALSDAVKVAREKTRSKDTLIIVTADHGHVMTMSGYPKRGNPILGLAKNGDDQPLLASDDMPYTTLGYANGPGTMGVDGPRRVDLSSMDTQALDFRQPSLIPMGSETHSGEEVAIYADGPGAHLFRKTHEQSYIYHVMNYAKARKNHGKWQWGWWR
ncbi:alkaline phosphatase [Parendozoicomonas sp. Alg238-R29]|uniref:alkaline phosphatase n=1 Tax=Parendozoicomonas sp. Alg238-R29 TaxID=2993446 RepID=UPI00248EE9E6|nr:alkaline phosphatase [Parendozoicomonas sp. Alg238-R29]